MTGMLERCSIFVELPSGTFLQICGFPVSELEHLDKQIDPTTLQQRRAMLFCQRAGLKRFRIAKASNGQSAARILGGKMFQIPANKASSDWAQKFVKMSAYVLKQHERCPYENLLGYYTKSDGHASPGNDDNVSVDDSFLSHSNSYSSVALYAYASIKWILPKEIKSCRVFMAQVKRKLGVFIRLRRFETMAVSELLRGLPLSQCGWVPLKSSSAEAGLLVKKMVENLLVWIFNEYLVQLLKSSFYITESTAHAKRLFYFRHDAWNKLTAPFLNALKSTMFDKAPASHCQRAVSKLRLVPKGSTFRPVVNFRPSSFGGAPEALAKSRATHNGLRNLHHILYHSAKSNPHLLGSSLLNVDEVCSRLQAFKSTPGVMDSPFYFVKIDFTACFDNIPTSKLLDVIIEKALPKVSVIDYYRCLILKGRLLYSQV